MYKAAVAPLRAHPPKSAPRAESEPLRAARGSYVASRMLAPPAAESVETDGEREWRLKLLRAKEQKQSEDEAREWQESLARARRATQTSEEEEWKRLCARAQASASPADEEREWQMLMARAHRRATRPAVTARASAPRQNTVKTSGSARDPHAVNASGSGEGHAQLAEERAWGERLAKARALAVSPPPLPRPGPRTDYPIALPWDAPQPGAWAAPTPGPVPWP